MTIKDILGKRKEVADGGNLLGCGWRVAPDVGSAGDRLPIRVIQVELVQRQSTDAGAVHQEVNMGNAGSVRDAHDPDDRGGIVAFSVDAKLLTTIQIGLLQSRPGDVMCVGDKICYRSIHAVLSLG